MKKKTYQEVYEKTRKKSKVAVAIVKKENGEFNSITLEWFTKTSIDPVMYAVSIGHERFSYQCFQKADYFILTFPSQSQLDFVKLSGSKSGRDMNKLKDVDYFISNYSKLPILRDSLAAYECKMVSQVKSGDHTLYIGEVINSWTGDKNDKVFTIEDFKN